MKISTNYSTPALPQDVLKPDLVNENEFENTGRVQTSLSLEPVDRIEIPSNKSPWLTTGKIAAAIGVAAILAGIGYLAATPSFYSIESIQNLAGTTVTFNFNQNQDPHLYTGSTGSARVAYIKCVASDNCRGSINNIELIWPNGTSFTNDQMYTLTEYGVDKINVLAINKLFTASLTSDNMLLNFHMNECPLLDKMLFWRCQSKSFFSDLPPGELSKIFKA